MRGRSSDPLYCGVDVGASSTKLVLLDEDREVRGRSIRRSGVDYAATARACLAEAIDAAGAEAGRVRRTVSTGYGRRNVGFADDGVTPGQFTANKVYRAKMGGYFIETCEHVLAADNVIAIDPVAGLDTEASGSLTPEVAQRIAPALGAALGRG